ncbi:hypothetical protein ACKDCK_003176, partial [Acinetobacter baumannii]
KLELDLLESKYEEIDDTSITSVNTKPTIYFKGVKSNLSDTSIKLRNRPYTKITNIKIVIAITI